MVVSTRLCHQSLPWHLDAPVDFAPLTRLAIGALDLLRRIIGSAAPHIPLTNLMPGASQNEPRAAPEAPSPTDPHPISDSGSVADVAAEPRSQPTQPPTRPPRRWSAESLLWVVLAAVCGAVSAALLSLQLSAPEPQKQALPRLQLLGEPLALDPKTPSRALQRLQEHVDGLFDLRLPNGQIERLRLADLGVQIDKERLAQLLRDSVDPTSPLSRWRRRQGLGPDDVVELPAPLALDAERALPRVLAIKDEWDRTAVDARLDLEKRQVLPSRQGWLLDVDASLRALGAALKNGASAVDLVFETIKPQRTTEQLTGVRFDHVLAAFETPYDRSAKARARTFNLRLAASRLDGTVLLPGEEFDFNRVVGPRDEANGYKVAPVIAQGELVDGIGGGTCQISGTLHAAAFFAGLEIVERYPHTRPSSYIKLGLDATVVYPTITYRFRNPFDFPVVLHQTVKDGVVRAEILGPEIPLTVTLIRRIVGAVPYEEAERPDDRLARGERVLAQRGVPGFRVRMYRILRDGRHARRERWDMLYPATTQIVAVGTAESTQTGAARNDRHGEYTADELLVMTHLPNAEGVATLREDREPGRFGELGWTSRAGMPQFESRE